MKNLSNIFKAKKLIKISMSYDDKKKVINSIKITGDFFIHPEETLEILDGLLVGIGSVPSRSAEDPICPLPTTIVNKTS